MLLRERLALRKSKEKRPTFRERTRARFKARAVQKVAVDLVTAPVAEEAAKSFDTMREDQKKLAERSRADRTRPARRVSAASAAANKTTSEETEKATSTKKKSTAKKSATTDKKTADEKNEG